MSTVESNDISSLCRRPGNSSKVLQPLLRRSAIGAIQTSCGIVQEGSSRFGTVLGKHSPGD